MLFFFFFFCLPTYQCCCGLVEWLESWTWWWTVGPLWMWMLLLMTSWPLDTWSMLAAPPWKTGVLLLLGLATYWLGLANIERFRQHRNQRPAVDWAEVEHDYFGHVRYFTIVLTCWTCAHMPLLALMHVPIKINLTHRLEPIPFNLSSLTPFNASY